jgi:hypothetical protein
MKQASNPRLWTEETIDLLRELAGTMTAREIGGRMGRTFFAVHRKMRQLGLQGVHTGAQRLPEGAPRTMGTPAQQAAIRAADGKLCAEELARQLCLSPNTVHRYAQRMGVALNMMRRWTTEEDQALRDAASQGARAAAQATGHTNNAVRYRASLLGIKITRCRLRKAPAVRAPAVRPAKVRAVKQVSKSASQRVSQSASLRVSRPALRQVEDRGSRIEYCSQCGAPVSNWEQHYERMGHRRAAA